MAASKAIMTLAAATSLFADTSPLISVRPAAEDYARVMDGGRYFVHSDGRPFIPIGYNHNPDWPNLIEANPDSKQYLPSEVDQEMAHLHEQGVNILRMMIETPPSGNLEQPIGTFSTTHMRWIDTIVLAARKHGIKLLMTPWDTFWMNKRWDTSTYNPALGGPLQSKIDFITSPQIREIQKRRLKFMIDRWGNTGTIFGWELMNEIDIWWGATPAQIGSWLDDMSRFVRSYEKQRWGRNHLISASFADAMPSGEMGDVAFGAAGLDYATTHLYIGVSKAPKEPVGPAKTEIRGVRYALGKITDARPYMDTENGPINGWIKDGALDDSVFHNMIWAHLASGGAGSGFRWPYRHPHVLSEGMLDSLRAMSRFCEKVRWSALSGDRTPFEVSGDKNAATCGFATKRLALAWSSEPGPLTFRWVGDGPVRYQLFDTIRGKWIGSGRAAGGRIDLPSQSIAVVLSREKN